MALLHATSSVVNSMTENQFHSSGDHRNSTSPLGPPARAHSSHPQWGKSPSIQRCLCRIQGLADPAPVRPLAFQFLQGKTSDQLYPLTFLLLQLSWCCHPQGEGGTDMRLGDAKLQRSLCLPVRAAAQPTGRVEVVTAFPLRTLETRQCSHSSPVREETGEALGPHEVILWPAQVHGQGLGRGSLKPAVSAASCVLGASASREDEGNCSVPRAHQLSSLKLRLIRKD